MKKDSFEKKLASYVAMAAAYLASCPEVDAQIMYTDVNSDLVISNGYFNLDLNNDGVVDVKLFNHQFAGPVNGETCSGPCSNTAVSSGYVKLDMLGQNQILETSGSSSSSGYGLIQPLNFGATIGGANIFGDGDTGNGAILNTYLAAAWYSCNGSSSGYGNSWAFGVMWSGQEKYLGLKIKSGTNSYYGWARIELGNNDEIILKDYAVNSIPDSSIIAGDTGGGCSINNLANSPSGFNWMCDDSMNVQLFNSVTMSIQWMKNGNWLNGETDSVYTINQVGNYQALVSDGACSILVNAVQIDTVFLNIDYVCAGNNPCIAFASLIISSNAPANTYSYLWSNGSTTGSIVGVPSGTYEATVTTSACNVSDSGSVVLSSNGFSISESNVDSLCGNHGSIDVEITGGTSPYNYSWSNGATTQDINNLSTGNYQLTVHDANNCSNNLTVPITVFSIPALSESHFDAGCITGGSINTSVAGGIPSYQYIWNTGQVTPDIYNLSSGTYFLTVTDIHSCTDTISVAIDSVAIPSLTETHTDSLCGNSGIIDLTVNGGTPIYHYNWSNGQHSEDIAFLSSGNYSITVTDANGCKDSISISLINFPLPTVASIVRNGNTLIEPTVFDSYQWLLFGNPIVGATNQQYDPTQNGDYQVQVTDSNGCTATSNIFNFVFTSINEIESLEINLHVDSKYLQLIFHSEKFIGSQLQFFNATGELIIELVAEKTEEQINIEQLPRGIYFLSIRNGEVSGNYKIAIQ